MSSHFEIPLIISVDDHVMEPPDLWTARAPDSIKDRVPRVERVPDRYTWKHGKAYKSSEPAKPGEEYDVWQYEDYRFPLYQGLAAAGIDPHKIDNGPIRYAEMRDGAKYQGARLVDMASNHVEAAVCFPNTLPRFCGQTFAERSDKELALWCLRTFNDWVIDEWCGGAALGKLIPVTVAPLWDIDLAVAEIERCAAKGSYALSFSENTTLLGLPAIYSGYWDPVFQACEETGTTICVHVGSSSHVYASCQEAPFIVGSTMAYVGSMGSVLDFIFSGTLERHPNLKLMISEGQAGWLPYLIEQADKFWSHRGNSAFGSDLPSPPSSYIPGKLWTCIYDDDTALRERNIIGMDQLCYETDYPHADGSFPHSYSSVEKMISSAGLTEEETYKLVRGNAIDALGLERFGLSHASRFAGASSGTSASA
jgi:predicted TIM-barrel fold metal-dependent hydrolase